MLIRHHAGERVWGVLREPSPEAEDARREHRELERLTHERVAHANRISALLVLHNLRPGVVIGGREWPTWWSAHRYKVPELLRAELERECERLKLVKDQVRAIEAAHRREPAQGKQPLVAQLARLGAIGPKSAWVLVKEVFGWREFSNRRELASSLVLVPTPHSSGTIDREQGISKAGNRRVRSLLVELAWNSFNGCAMHVLVALSPSAQPLAVFERPLRGVEIDEVKDCLGSAALRSTWALWGDTRPEEGDHRRPL